MDLINKICVLHTVNKYHLFMFCKIKLFSKSTIIKASAVAGSILLGI